MRWLLATGWLGAFCALAFAEELPPGPSLGSHMLWHIYASEEASQSELRFRKFALEGKTIRNTFVLTCPRERAKQVYLEVIPPKSLLPRLAELTANRATGTIIWVNNYDKGLGFKGEVDPIAGFIDLTDDSWPGLVTIMDAATISVAMFDDGLGWNLVGGAKASKEVNRVLASSPEIRQKGGIRTLDGAELRQMCRDFRG